MRTTRSKSKQALSDESERIPATTNDDSQTEQAHITAHPSQSTNPTTQHPPLLTTKTTGLTKLAHTLLLHKQARLRSLDSIPDHPLHLHRAIYSTLVFAAHQAGTAICISRQGHILTCYHCVAETDEEITQAQTKGHWLLFADGTAINAKLLQWDQRRHLALLRVSYGETPSTQALIASGTGPLEGHFPFCPIAPSSPPVSTPLICIGHPGSEDLENPPSPTTGSLRATDYDVLSVSYGRYRGLAKDQDPQDNEEIGALMHTCWTYWGHSGAPLIVSGGGRERVGKVVGLHSSWDEKTGMRRGVGLLAIREFLAKSEEEHEYRLLGGE